MAMEEVELVAVAVGCLCWCLSCFVKVSFCAVSTRSSVVSGRPTGLEGENVPLSGLQ
jgi:hypothetical protein